MCCLSVQGEMMVPSVLLMDGYNIPNSLLETPGVGKQKLAACRSWNEAGQGPDLGHIVKKSRVVVLGHR